MELSGGGSGLFPQAVGSPAAPVAAPMTKIECLGPATADGFKRTVDLKGDVRVQQGENKLRADHVELSRLCGVEVKKAGKTALSSASNST
jgi:hypothetical protein